MVAQRVYLTIKVSLAFKNERSLAHALVCFRIKLKCVKLLFVARLEFTFVEVDFEIELKLFLLWCLVILVLEN